MTKKSWHNAVTRVLVKHGAVPAIIIATGIAVTIALRYGH